MLGARSFVLAIILPLLVSPPAATSAAEQGEDLASDLEIAANIGDLSTVKNLLDAGVDPNTRLAGERTPLIYAAGSAHPEVVRLLVDRGARVNDADDDGLTPLLMASCILPMMPDGKLEEIPEGTLVIGGSDPPEVIVKRRTEVVRFLLARGAYVSLKSSDGQTALICAANAGHLNLIEPLLNAGAELEARDSGGATPLMFAAYRGYDRILTKLLLRGANVNARDGDGLTPLMVAAQGGSIEVARLLLEHGADAAARAKDEMTALDWALATEHQEVAEELRRHAASGDGPADRPD